MSDSEDKVIISRSKLEAMEAELAAYRSNKNIQQQIEEIERQKGIINKFKNSYCESVKDLYLKEKSIEEMNKEIQRLKESIERMKKNRFRFWKKFE